MVNESKHWCFTLNNYTDDEYSGITGIGEECTYLVVGKELSSTGTPHLQGYVEFSRKKRIGRVKRILGSERLHLESRRGTAQQAADYCKKDGVFEEIGQLTVPRQGHRTDLEEIKEILDQGGRVEDVAQSHFGTFLQHSRPLREYEDIVLGNGGKRDVSVIVLWGPPGTGKSNYVYETEPDLYITFDNSLKWFDGYRGEPAILVDDYRGDASPSFLLRFLDVYPLRLPIKSSSRILRATRIYITSNKAPREWHHEEQAPILRRLTKVVHLSTPRTDVDIVQRMIDES